jgi:hypothetical protein
LGSNKQRRAKHKEHRRQRSRLVAEGTIEPLKPHSQPREFLNEEQAKRFVEAQNRRLRSEHPDAN